MELPCCWVVAHPTSTNMKVRKGIEPRWSCFLGFIILSLRFMLTEPRSFTPGLASCQQDKANLGPACCYTARPRNCLEAIPLRPRIHPLWLTASLLFAISSIGTPAFGDEPVTRTQEEIILQILDLREQIEDLLAALPPAVRGEVERRWEQRESVPAVEPPDPDPIFVEPLTEIESGVELPTGSTLETSPILPVASEPIAAESEPQVESAQESAPPCGGFHLLDTNGDQLVSGADRQWRFLRLWFDDGDGVLADSELESLFELGVRMIDVDLRFYVNEDGDSEDVDAEDLIELARVGKGNSSRRTGALVIESGRLTRGGMLTLSGPDGDRATGYQPLGSGLFLTDNAGNSWPVICSESG